MNKYINKKRLIIGGGGIVAGITAIVTPSIILTNKNTNKKNEISKINQIYNNIQKDLINFGYGGNMKDFSTALANKWKLLDSEITNVTSNNGNITYTTDSVTNKERINYTITYTITIDFEKYIHRVFNTTIQVPDDKKIISKTQSNNISTIKTLGSLITFYVNAGNDLTNNINGLIKKSNETTHILTTLETFVNDGKDFWNEFIWFDNLKTWLKSANNGYTQASVNSIEYDISSKVVLKHYGKIGSIKLDFKLKYQLKEPGLMGAPVKTTETFNYILDRFKNDLQKVYDEINADNNIILRWEGKDNSDEWTIPQINNTIIRNKTIVLAAIKLYKQNKDVLYINYFKDITKDAAFSTTTPT